MATPKSDKSDALPNELLIQRSGAAVGVSLSGRPDAPGETLWATKAPVQNVIETVSRVEDDQRDHGEIIARLEQQARDAGTGGEITLAPAQGELTNARTQSEDAK